MYRKLSSRRSRCGFTLVELLVVIAIIGSIVFFGGMYIFKVLPARKRKDELEETKKVMENGFKEIDDWRRCEELWQRTKYERQRPAGAVHQSRDVQF